MGKPDSGQHVDLSASALSAAERLGAQVRAIESQWASLPDRSQWADGEGLLSRVQSSADALAGQIKLSFNADHP